MELATSSSKAGIDDLTYYHFDSKIHTCIDFHNYDDMWMVPLTSLIESCYLVVNKNHCDRNIVDDIYIDDMTAYIVRIMNKWGDNFYH